ncbi:hypothetical protein GE061_008429 [Apolygus lucorum]|uniref:Uncharacterized protein n=1 Tax=Apolygus lucorum TaxID=248454 RepID=A0A6A4IQH8_APOLU|nr:hypothetical protein GE061_008429 [Apolygus lucorum]
MSKISVSHCVVPGCAGRRGHTFPLQDPIRMNNWLEAVKWKHLPMPHKSAFVCYNHFKKTDYRQREDRKIIPGVKTRMRLKKKAVPSVFEPYHGSDSPKDANVLLPPLLIEVGDRENSSLHDESYTIGDLKFDLEDGVSESDVNASIFNALNCSSSVEDVDISSFAESVRSKLFADHEETQSILLHSTEGMLEITTKLPTTHPLDYDSDMGEGGFITISRNFEGLSDGSDSDIIIPLKNKSVRFEPFEEISVRSEPTIVPTVTNIIVFDANEEGMSTMKSLLLAQIKADENGRPNPKHIDSKHVSVEYDSQDDVKLIQHQTDYRYITEKIKHLNLTHQAPKISEYTKPSNTNNLLKEIKKTLPKVVVNMRKVMVIRNSNKCPKFSSPPASILRNYQSGVFRKTESSPALNSKLPTINFGVKTLYDRRMQLCSKGFQNVNIGKQPKFIIISEKSKESNSKVRDEECDESPEVKLPDATTISGTLSYGNSEPQCKDVKSNDVLLYDGDSDSSLDLHISLSSDSESRVMEDRGNENELISNDSPDFMRKNRATGVLTFDLDCEDEVAGKSHDESTRSARMDNEEPGFETTTGDFEVGANENENSSKKSGLPTNSEVGMLKPSERVDDAAACNSDSPTNSANNSSEHSKKPEEIMSISNNKNESIEVDEAEGQKTADFSNSVVVGRTVNLLNESELNNGDFAGKVDASPPPHQVMDLKETATDHDAGKSGGIDVQADTVLEDDSLETKDYSAGSENQGATDGEGRWECLSITNSDLSDSEYYDGLVQENCLQFEVVDNDSEMVLEEINCSLEPFIVLENDLEMVQEDVHDTTDHPKLYQDHPVIDAISEEMYDETGDTSPPSQFDVCEANSKPMAPTQGSSIRLIVPEHMLLPLGGPSTTKRKPPPLILPDHDYTYGTTNFKRKRRKKMENRESE